MQSERDVTFPAKKPPLHIIHRDRRKRIGELRHSSCLRAAINSREGVVYNNAKAEFAAAREELRFHLTSDGIVHSASQFTLVIWKKCSRSMHAHLVDLRRHPAIGLANG